MPKGDKIASPEAKNSEKQQINPSYEQWKNLEQQHHETHFDAKDYLVNRLEQPKIDDMVRTLVKKFISIDPKEFSKGSDLEDILYDEMRYDEKSAGKINHSDLAKFYADVAKDCREGTNRGIERDITFDHFKSWHILGGERIRREEMVHRIYINSKADNLMAFTGAVYNQFKNNGVPFYFKIHKSFGTSDAEKGPKDGFVLYTSSKHLGKTIDALEQAGKKHPEIIEGLNDPPEICGKLGEKWLGYASEPNDNPEHSYTSYICKIFINTLEEQTKRWAEDNPQVTIGGENIQDYMSTTFEQRRRRLQVLLSQIPKVDKKYVRDFRETFAHKLSEQGFDPNSICLTPHAKKMINDE